ncbi:hypothetical protein [Salinactinospora qingdaonensis]|uniref:Uncharacterized protein n=1 Tax=Salinactinospora qingdaonensis TaxID=702744 RepID=A0ABP7FCD0_9ACTN
MSFDLARKVADTVLFEGYVLYPYRASAVKNQVRWQFGVLAPPGATTGEPSFAQTECLIEAEEPARVDVRVRFMQVHTRFPAAGEEDTHAPAQWEEGTLREIDTAATVTSEATATSVPFEFPGGEHTSDGAVLRGHPLRGAIELTTEPIPGPHHLHKLRVRVTNHTPERTPGAGRNAMLLDSLVSAHTLLSVSGASFLSLLEPPERAAQAAGHCENLHTWPVLIGEPGRCDLMLSAPIILYDYPEVAPESPTDLCDGTEIDEILTLRTMTLTEEEKREARATDMRAARIIDHVDSLPPEMLERLHGAMRYLRDVAGVEPEPGQGPAESAAPPPSGPASVIHHETPWWDPGQDASVSPETDSVPIAGGTAMKGSTVVLRPGNRRADVHDMFLAGRQAMVEGVFFDVDGGTYLAVTLADDPAVDLHQSHGRYLYFTPDEVELCEQATEGGQR